MNKKIDVISDIKGELKIQPTHPLENQLVTTSYTYISWYVDCPEVLTKEQCFTTTYLIHINIS